MKKPYAYEYIESLCNHLSKEIEYNEQLQLNMFKGEILIRKFKGESDKSKTTFTKESSDPDELSCINISKKTVLTEQKENSDEDGLYFAKTIKTANKEESDEDEIFNFHLKTKQTRASENSDEDDFYF